MAQAWMGQEARWGLQLHAEGWAQTGSARKPPSGLVCLLHPRSIWVSFVEEAPEESQDGWDRCPPAPHPVRSTRMSGKTAKMLGFGTES